MVLKTLAPGPLTFSAAGSSFSSRHRFYHLVRILKWEVLGELFKNVALQRYIFIFSLKCSALILHNSRLVPCLASSAESTYALEEDQGGFVNSLRSLRKIVLKQGWVFVTSLGHVVYGQPLSGEMPMGPKQDFPLCPHLLPHHAPPNPIRTSSEPHPNPIKPSEKLFVEKMSKRCRCHQNADFSITILSK